jgi:hypothetical protein
MRPECVLLEEEKKSMAKAMEEEKGLREVAKNKLKEIKEFAYDKNRNNLFLHIAVNLASIFPEFRTVRVLRDLNDGRRGFEVKYEDISLLNIDKAGINVRDMYLERDNWTEMLGDCGYGGKEGDYEKLAENEHYRDKAESLRADAEVYICYVNENRQEALGGNKYSFVPTDGGETETRDALPLWNDQLVADMKKADRLWDELMVAVDNHCVALAKVGSLS